jgi:hypothetical protein
LIVTGRRDSTVGYSDATELLERYLHATLAVIESAGHALMVRPHGPDLAGRGGCVALLGDRVVADKAYANKDICASLTR